ncbi:MAG: AMP-binding protein [Deltaproteobacteria bacterium]|nr:AMP-binding protein [Deltaproteobacteria bacterium]
MSTARASLVARALLAPPRDHGVDIDGGARASWSELVGRAQRRVPQLQAAGVGPGDRVLLTLPTSLSFVEALLASWLAGAVPVPLPAPQGARAGAIAARIAHVARIARPRAVLHPAGEPLDLEGQDVPAITFDESAASGTPTAVPAPSHTSSHTAHHAAPHTIALAETAFLQFTSGSTGNPRGVVVTHAALQAQLEQLHAGMGVRAGDSAVSWLPLFHDMGLVGGLLLPFAYGLDVTLLSPLAFLLRPARWLQAISRSRGTMTAAPSSAYALCAARVRDQELHGLDLSCGRVALDGAEAVRAEAMDAFAARMAPVGFSPSAFMPAYGLAESTLAVCMAPRGHGARVRHVDAALLAEGELKELPEGSAGAVRVVSSGTPVPGARVRVVDEAGASLPEGRVGLLRVSSPSLGAGYFNDPAASAAAFRDGELDTGDLGALLDGELYVTGRVKDTLVVRGRKIGAEDVEAAVEQALRRDAHHRPPVALAFGVPAAAVDGERVVVLVGMHGKATLELERHERAVAAAREAVGAHDVVVVVVAASSLPRTTSGKLRRFEARGLWQRGALSPGLPA